MKKSMFIVALAAMSLASCSNDEVLDIQKTGVQFSVVADKASRGTVVTTNDIAQFAVYGFNADGNMFMEGANGAGKEINKETTGDVSKWVYSPTQFWPTEAAIDFYSIHPATVLMDKTNKKIVDYTVSTNVANQVDLLYALNLGCTKDNSTSGVPVNFRHALAQIVFKATNTNPNLKVDIQGVKVVKVNSKGTFEWPTASTTTPNYSADKDGTKDTELDATWGVWNKTSLSEETSYTATCGRVVLDANAVKGEIVADLSAAPLLLLPQPLTPAPVVNEKMQRANGSYFAISCKVYNVVNGVETLLWPATDEYKDVLIPLNSPDKVLDGNNKEQAGWKQGKKYIYTFIFGEGAGYEPEPDPENPDTNEPVDPVLVPVKFTVTVDEFQTATLSQDMKTYND